ncbi:MAG: LysR substrate-binding domain-containing protein [Planctomycetota bacterium]|jgi:DNA-binding transcriptional LysR family regulator
MSWKSEPLSIRQLEVFVSLVDHESFTRAARHLGLSQSTVSGHIADLERRLDVRVVERGRARVRVTPAGQALIGPARRTLQSERATRMAVEELRGLLRGRLVVGGSTIPAVYLLPRLLGRFHDLHPDVSLRVVTGDSGEIVEAVRGSNLELGIVGTRPTGTGLESLPVGEDGLSFVLPPDHALAKRRAVTVEEALACPLILREEGSGTREATLRALEAAQDGEKPPPMHVVAEAGSTESVKAFVRAGIGTAFLSSLAVADEIAAGTLTAVRVEGVDVRRTFHLVTREDAYLGPAARALKDLAVASCPVTP